MANKSSNSIYVVSVPEKRWKWSPSLLQFIHLRVVRKSNASFGFPVFVIALGPCNPFATRFVSDEHQHINFRKHSRLSQPDP